jgi:hypothetical protein
MFVALDCFLKSLFIFVIFYLVVTAYKKYNKSTTTSSQTLLDSFEATENVEEQEQQQELIEERLEPIPSGEPIDETPDNVPSDPIEMIGDGTKMFFRGKTIDGQRQLILKNTEQALELKKKFDVASIQDLVRFEDGSDVFVVYRALSTDDFLDYFVFWNNQTPFRLSRPNVSSDPSRESIKPVKMHKDIEFMQNVTYPSELSGFIQERAAAFENRNTTMGPTAIDSHRV